MLSRQFRLRHRRDLGRVYRLGRTTRSGVVSVRYLSNHQAHCRATVVISSKVMKHAVTRNRARRRLRGLLADLWSGLRPGFDLIISLHGEVDGLEPAELRQHLRRCLAKANLIR